MNEDGHNFIHVSNQTMVKLTESESHDILSQFPTVEFAFAYGSGVMEQGGYDYSQLKSLPMLDLIFVVNDTEQWHTENIQRNPSHYTSMIALEPGNIKLFQERLKAHFWFNAYVPCNISTFPNRLMKYGIINKTQALTDLQRWSNLYLAGRLHKPVHVLKGNEELEEAMGFNHEQAIRTSLLLLPERFNEVDLYLTVASLSYVGDPRMFLGENPKKVVNLVTPMVNHYRSLYAPAIQQLTKSSNILQINSYNHIYAQNVSPTIRWDLCKQLPSTLQRYLSIK